MNTGQVISLVGHTGLIGFMLFGGVWNSDPLPFEVAEVAMISEADLAAMQAAANAPVAAPTPVLPETPAEDAAPEPTPAPDPTPEPAPEPTPEPAPAPDPVPEVETAPPAEAEVSDVAPVIIPPQEDLAALVPGRSLRPKLKPIERVAPEPVAAPAPDTPPAEEATPETSDAPSEAPREESEAGAPEEATTEINPEAKDDESLAPLRSARPKLRPRRAPEPADTSGGVNSALAEALGGDAPAAPEGPPLTGGEKQGLRLAVSRCWNVGALSTDALAVTVTVGFEMTREGRPVTNTIKMIASEGGDSSAVKRAYEAARRAIIRCGSSGYELPQEKYDHWKNVEIKFNPESMR